MSLYQSFKTSDDLEQGGVWFRQGEAKFLVKRISSRNYKYRTTLANLMRPHKRAIEADTLSEETGREISIAAFLEGALITWENVADKEGKTIPFSKQAAINLFQDLPDLFDTLLSEAQSSKHFIEVDNLVKN